MSNVLGAALGLRSRAGLRIAGAVVLAVSGSIPAIGWAQVRGGQAWVGRGTAAAAAGAVVYRMLRGGVATVAAGHDGG